MRIGNILAFIFGAVMGSFLNVCIYRMPINKSVVWPGSHCPECEKRIPWYDNIPFLSYLMLGGKCRFCKKQISLRYLIVELLTAVMFVMLFRSFGVTYNLFFYIIFISALIVATFVDLKHRIIPDEISVGIMITGFILSSARGFHLSPFSFSFSPMVHSFLGILAGGGIIYFTGLAFDLIYFKLLKRPPIQGETESIGGGDVKLLAMIGAFLGWQNAIMVFFLAAVLGAVIGMVNLIIQKDHTIPYGPFLSLAAIIALFWSDKIMNLIVAPLFLIK